MDKAPLELLVANHMAAEGRRRSGRPVWDRTIDVHGIVAQLPDASEESAAMAAGEIAALLRAEAPEGSFECGHPAYDIDLAEAVEHLEDLRPDSYAHDPDYSVLKALDARLAEISDWADANRIWLGDGTPSPAGPRP